MGWRLTLWAFLLAVPGGWAGIYAGHAIDPGNHRAPGYGLLVGAVLGGCVGVAYVWLTHRRRPGD